MPGGRNDGPVETRRFRRGTMALSPAVTGIPAPCG